MVLSVCANTSLCCCLKWTVEVKRSASQKKASEDYAAQRLRFELLSDAFLSCKDEEKLKISPLPSVLVGVFPLWRLGSLYTPLMDFLDSKRLIVRSYRPLEGDKSMAIVAPCDMFSIARLSHRESK